MGTCLEPGKFGVDLPFEIQNIFIQAQRDIKQHRPFQWFQFKTRMCKCIHFKKILNNLKNQAQQIPQTSAYILKQVRKDPNKMSNQAQLLLFWQGVCKLLSDNRQDFDQLEQFLKQSTLLLQKCVVKQGLGYVLGEYLAIPMGCFSKVLPHELAKLLLSHLQGARLQSLIDLLLKRRQYINIIDQQQQLKLCLKLQLDYVLPIYGRRMIQHNLRYAFHNALATVDSIRRRQIYKTFLDQGLISINFQQISLLIKQSKPPNEGLPLLRMFLIAALQNQINSIFQQFQDQLSYIFVLNLVHWNIDNPLKMHSQAIGTFIVSNLKQVNRLVIYLSENLENPSAQQFIKYLLQRKGKLLSEQLGWQIIKKGNYNFIIPLLEQQIFTPQLSVNSLPLCYNAFQPVLTTQDGVHNCKQFFNKLSTIALKASQKKADLKGVLFFMFKRMQNTKDWQTASCSNYMLKMLIEKEKILKQLQSQLQQRQFTVAFQSLRKQNISLYLIKQSGIQLLKVKHRAFWPITQPTHHKQDMIPPPPLRRIPSYDLIEDIID